MAPETPSRRTQAPKQRAPRGSVVTYAPGKSAHGHEAMTRRKIAEDIAALLGIDFAGEHDWSARYREPLYFVPADSIVGVDTAAALGIRSERDLFGGVVPHAFVATKSITHPLFEPQARGPGRLVAGVPGARGRLRCLPASPRSAAENAIACAGSLLERGPVRVKRSLGIGGRGPVPVQTTRRSSIRRSTASTTQEIALHRHRPRRAPGRRRHVQRRPGACAAAWWRATGARSVSRRTITAPRSTAAPT